jgi:ribonucleotide monophosphatase NagD (HAD superfamily)
MNDIHAACSAVLRGAAFYCASDVPFFATQQGPAFGYSCAIAGAIVRVTGVEPELTGKPSQHALRFVAGRLGVAPDRVAVIGDDPRVEIEMARGGGALGIGVTTGTTSREQWAAQDEVRRPHHVIDSLAEFLPLGLV